MDADDATVNFYAKLSARLDADLQHEDGALWLCSPVRHVPSTLEDVGWGCGWRNCQMLLSSTQTGDCQSTVCNQVLCQDDGSAALPDIPTLQCLLEAAWAAGFDPDGAAQLGHKVQGAKTWIGTTEIAVILRFLGVGARIIDFGVRAHSSAGAPPHASFSCDACGMAIIQGTRYHSLVLDDYDLCARCHRQHGGGPVGPFECVQPPPGSADRTAVQLLNWAHTYFTEGGPKEGQARGLLRTSRPPLYLQHQGHSRTVIGLLENAQGAQALLVLDPAVTSSAMHKALTVPKYWRSGMLLQPRSLGHPQYQVLRFDSTGAGVPESDLSKVILAAEAFP
ncbi:hypothetical protein ACKKBF_B14635 [Auxenochlorella protothecoides x Auxenochlorella symbiontica]